MKNMQRSMRRYHKERMRNKARKLWPTWDDAFKMGDHLAYVQTIYLRNPRRVWKQITRKEYIAYLRYKEELEEFDINIKKGIRDEKHHGYC